jgi:hypothetical protein
LQVGETKKRPFVGQEVNMTKLTVYHGTSGDFDNIMLRCQPSAFANEKPFDYGIWFTTDFTEATYFLDPNYEDNSRVIVCELDITNAVNCPEDTADAKALVDAGTNVLLAAESPDSIFVGRHSGCPSTCPYTVISEVRCP